MEKLERRIQAMEQQLCLKQPKLDLIQVVRDIRIEQNRLMALTPEEYEAEISQPPHSKENQASRVGVEDQKHFQSLSLENKKAYLGFAGFAEADYAKALEDRDRKLKDPDNWISRMIKERQKNIVVPRSPKP